MEKNIDDIKKELEASQEAIKRLNIHYEQKVGALKEEVSYLKEQLMAQQDMLKNAVNYAEKLGSELNRLRKKVESGNFQSIH